MTARKWFAQDREDKIVARIFRRIHSTNRWAVEIGAMDGEHGSNTAHFRSRGWTVRLFDQAPLDPMVEQATITAENVNAVLASAGVPRTFDLLSLDIDGNDLWVWKALAFRPRVVVIEYNPLWKPSKSRTVVYDPERFWDGTIYYGASILALVRLGKQKGYDLVSSTRSNLIFVRKGLMTPKPAAKVQRPTRIKRPDPLERPWQVYARG